MAFIAIQGGTHPPIPPLQLNPTFSSVLIDATGEKIAVLGHVWNKDRTTKSITKVGFRVGALTSAGGSGLVLSLQDVDQANGPPFRPDGTQDQTVSFLASSLTSNAWFQSGALSAARSVAYGEQLAVVLEFDGSGRLGADAVEMSHLLSAAVSGDPLASGVSLFASGSWGAQSLVSNMILEFNDGTFGTFMGAWPMSATSSTTFTVNSAADEIGVEFTVPTGFKVDGAWFYALAGSTANFDVVLYSGTTALATFSIDGNALRTGSSRPIYVSLAEQSLATGTTYRLVLKPTTANNVTIYYFDVNAAGHLQAHGGLWNSDAAHVTRVDAGSWAATTTTRRPFCGLSLSAVDAGSGSIDISTVTANISDTRLMLPY